MGEDPSWKKAKFSLLKSGLPLESQVSDLIRTMKPLGLSNNGKYHYEREVGQCPMSIDFSVTTEFDLGADFDIVQLVFLIECKYCIPGTNWFFTYEPNNN